MSQPYKNMVMRLEEAVYKEAEMLKDLYSPQTCHSRAQLQELMDKELLKQVELKMKIIKMSKEAIMEGMRLDGVEYPSILWADQIGPKLPDFMLHSLREQAPVVHAAPEAGNPNVKSGGSRQITAYVVTAAGVVMTITGLALNPMNLLLLSMGIVFTSTGLVLVVKEVYFDKKSLLERKPSVVPEDSAQLEAQQTEAVLKKILNQNYDVLRDWNQKLGKLAIEAMRNMKTEAEKQA